MGYHTTHIVRGALLALALPFALAGCAGDEEAEAPQHTEAAKPAVSASRPAASRPAAVAAAPVAPMPDIDPCALIPHAEAERILGKPLHARPMAKPRTRNTGGTFVSCEYGVGRTTGPRKALRLDLTIERSWKRKDVTLDGHWQTLTIGNGEAERVESLGGKAWWLPQPPPLRELLMVRGTLGIYELRTAWFGKSKLQRPQIEALAAALLAAE